MRTAGWRMKGETFPARHLVDTRGPNSHKIQQKMAVPNAVERRFAKCLNFTRESGLPFST